MATPTPDDMAKGVPQGVNIVARVPAPSGQGELLLDENGGVYDTGGQSFSGSYNSLRPEQRQGTRKFTNLVVDPKTGGYKLVSDQPGQEYNFGPSQHVQAMPKANPLYSDPAFLAYVANSGRDYETAAGEVARKKAAIQNALGLQLPEIKKQGEQKLESIYGNYASRGLTNPGQVSGGQVKDEATAQSDTLAQVGKAQAGAQTEIDDMVGGLAQKRQDLLAGVTQKGYGTAGTQDLDTQLKDVDRRYPLGGATGLKY